MNRHVRFVLAPPALAVLVFTGCSRQQPVVAAKEITLVRTAIVRAATAIEIPRYAGTVEPVAQVTLAFRVPGLVDQIHQVVGVDRQLRSLETGDFVPAGTVLASIRSAEYRARNDATQAQLSDALASRSAAAAQAAEAQAGFAQVELDWNRARKLFAGEALTKAEFDAASARYDAARARLDAARAQVAALEAKVAGAGAAVAETKVSLADTDVVAPFNAYVVARQVERGTFAQPGAPVFVLADLTRVKIIFFVPDTALRRFRPGVRVTAAVAAAGVNNVAGIVQSVSPSADPVTRNFRVEAVAPNHGCKLGAGLVASVSLPEEATANRADTGLAVPLSAVVRGEADGGFAVFVIDGQRVHRQTVYLGEIKGDEVTVTDGLRPNQRIVRDGVAQLRDGDRVRVTE
ncbi:MAG: efflux RND transporter periplasmic adaptor subunit [Bryobacterales bacterium]|nr:efflux RND transporter periplasmic adaptor subunit [Bryobacterales bacterium]MEB2363229.1 efflux RND transporter periplasmic adaptor subunit [Bryobacterales bacterium]